MTFTDIKTRIKNFCSLTSSEADDRIAVAINQHYRRVTASLGLNAVRFVTRSTTTTNGVSVVTFAEIEAIDRVIDTTTAESIRPLTRASLDEVRTSQPGTAAPTRWALNSTTADDVVIRLDTVPQTPYSLQVDGSTTLGNMSGTDEPLFSESFHDILSFLVIAEELLKKGNIPLAREFSSGNEDRPGRAETAIRELRLQVAEQATAEQFRQASRPTTGGFGGAGSGGGGTTGGTAYTQTALLTFDRGAGITPFAVAQADAPYVANLGAEFLGNVTTDRLIGRDSAGTGESEQLTVGGGIEFTSSGGIQRSALTGEVTASGGSGATTITNLAITTAKIAALAVTTAKLDDLAVTTAKLAADAVTYAKIQNVSAVSKLLGRGSAAGAGDVEEITVGTNLAMAATTLGVTAAGSTTQIQFNSGGVLAGHAGLIWDTGTTLLTASSILVQGGLFLASGQIGFPPTANPSSDANTLDEYEEFTWTPVIGGSGGTSGQTYTTQIGKGVKIGKLVFLSFKLVMSVEGTITTNVQIQGLPFTSSANAVGGLDISFWRALATNTVFIGGEVNSSATTCDVWSADAAGGSMTQTDNTKTQNGTELSGTICYQAAA